MEPNGVTAASGTPTSPDQQQHIRLACQACQRKKIKCDRTFPCGQCTRSGLQCQASTRKPRARHAGKRAIDSELRNRISKLESLVESLSGEVVPGEGNPYSDGDGEDEEDGENLAGARSKSASVGKFMGGNFWSSLTTEVQALREALEDEPVDDADTPTSPSTSSNPQNSGDYDLILCPPGSIYVMPGALIEPNPQLSGALCNVFCEYVDRLFKVFHVPTLRAHMIEGKPYLGLEHSSPGSRCVRTTVWYAAVNTMSESQCQMTLGMSRPDALHHYKRHVDVAMAQADLMATNDFATVQAFTIYIAALRASEGSRRVWTLTALAVRIGRGIGLDQETTPRNTFMTELRRRLWHYIRFLDIYVALDRGTEPQVSNTAFETPIAKNTNDSDFDDSSTTIPEHEGFTDMTYPRLIYDAIFHTYNLTVPKKNTTEETWQQRMDAAQQFEDTIREKYWKYCNRSDPFQRLVLSVSRSMVNSMKLRAVRPLHVHPSSTPPRVDSPYVLQIAINNLRASEAIACDAETAQYRWMVWVQWHALAVALAGLCALRDTSLANEAWVHVEQAYARNVQVVADNRTGMLWRPIELLYKKASAFRDHGRSLSISKDFAAIANANNVAAGQPNTIGKVDATMPKRTSPQPFQMMTPSTPHQQQFSSGQQQQQPLPGAMPTTGILNSPMDLSMDPSLMSNMTGTGQFNDIAMPNWPDVGNGDMSWMEFERLLEDLSNPAQAGAMGTEGMTVPGNMGMNWM